MLAFLVLTYLFITVVVGALAARYVNTSRDYILAGRKLGLILCGSAMFSTWFGSETIMGASAEFSKFGILGVIEDPFGTALCFILIGLFIARPLYKLNVLTIVDFYRMKFGRSVERITAVFMVLSYIGWVSAQLLAMAIIMKVVLGCSLPHGVLLSGFIVCAYTVVGGMWSISINDLIQTLVIFVGLIALSIFVLTKVDDFSAVIAKTPPRFFNFLPEPTFDGWVQYITAWITISLGSIPQQDVFQRVMSAKSEKVAVQASYLSGVLYLSVAIIPLFLVLLFKHVYPELMLIEPEQILPQAVMIHGSFTMKVFFFGALLSAIMSSSSGAVLAPATILGENILKPLFPEMTDRQFIFVLRVSVVFIVILSMFYAMVSNSVYYLVAESSAISLVSLLVPLLAGLYWRFAKKQGALLSILCGIAAWGVCRLTGHDHLASLAGLACSVLGMVAGSLLTFPAVAKSVLKSTAKQV